ncbi:MFS general substrate transporter [Mollisia scopiformis]|uniref:MFS general substrate transporter n=1 Tax=Mollisia scopiformis TaxID=149040 RepID=A0A194X9D7_MOLSC|nr:MFS general substrate transporter [Mollisia scopiformis]KUJ16734.1 MFS general substrate transporter [Mollisia scopiformis]
MDKSSINTDTDGASPTEAIHVETPDPETSKRLVWKLDLIVLPLLAIIYFTHSLDRANLGNAKTDGFEKDIGLKDNQYSLILILFYIPYGTLNIPATVLAKRYSPAVVIPCLMFCWGTIAASTAAVHNFGGILAARICLGVVEAGFFPSAIFYLTMFYTRTEIAKRISLFYMMGFVANAFSGLIAYSVFQWHRSLYNWQYLFIIEGSLTVTLAILAFILLPRSIAKSNYFTEAEKQCSKLRLQAESEIEGDSFSWSATLTPLLDWHSWMYGFMALCYGCAAASISNFLPTIVKRITVNTVKANLYTVAPNLSGGVFIVLICWLSDKTQQRALCAIGAVAISMIGFICLGTVDITHKTRLGYFFTFLLTFGSFTPAVLVPAWLSSNSISTSGRATTVGLVAGLQNIAGIISSESFRSQDAPIYAPALIISGCFEGAMCVTAAFAYLYYRTINRRLDSGKMQFVRGMEQNPNFRYVL